MIYQDLLLYFFEQIASHMQVLSRYYFVLHFFLFKICEYTFAWFKIHSDIKRYTHSSKFTTFLEPIGVLKLRGSQLVQKKSKKRLEPSGKHKIRTVAYQDRVQLDTKKGLSVPHWQISWGYWKKWWSTNVHGKWWRPWELQILGGLPAEDS